MSWTIFSYTHKQQRTNSFSSPNCTRAVYVNEALARGIVKLYEHTDGK